MSHPMHAILNGTILRIGSARRASALFICAAAILMHAPTCEGAARWNWKLSATRYRKLNTFQRAQYDKACKLFEAQKYRAAASEFEKFKIQFDDSEALPHILLMHGYSVHLAKDRHKAIKIYTEIIDYFPDSIEDAAPALYFIGTAHCDNGDIAKGLKAMKQMVDDEDYCKHRLAADAMLRLAENHVQNKEPDKALRYWKQIVTVFGNGKHRKQDVDKALENATRHYVRLGEYSSYKSWLAGDGGEPSDAQIVWICDNAARTGRHEISTMSRGAKRDAAARALFDFLSRHKPHYERSKATWQYYMNALGVTATSGEASTFASVAKDALGYAGAQSDEKSFKMLVQLLQATASTPVARTVLPQAVDTIAKRSQDNLERVRMYRQLMEALGDATAARTLVDKSVATLSRVTDKEAADREYASIIDWLRNQRQYELATIIAGRMHDKVKSSWKMYEIVGHGRGKWPEAAKILEEIENNSDGENALKARKARAWVYKERTREYEKAIKLYQNILEPPGTLWSIQYCYHKLGKLEDAIRTLTEIQNSFPDHAPRAAWTKAEYYHKAQDKKKAIACARYIMKAYTKSPEASRAHQMLEKYGIHTGGGVMDSEE